MRTCNAFRAQSADRARALSVLALCLLMLAAAPAQAQSHARFALPLNLPVWPQASGARLLAAHEAQPRLQLPDVPSDVPAWAAADFAALGVPTWQLVHQDATVELVPIAGQLKSKIIATVRAHDAGVTQLDFIVAADEEVTWTDVAGTKLQVTSGGESQGLKFVTLDLAAPLTPEVDFIFTADRVVPLNCDSGFMGFKSCEFGKSFAWATQRVLLRKGDTAHGPNAFDLHVVTPASLQGAAAGIPMGVDDLPDGRKIWHFHQPEPTENCAFYMGPYQPLDVPATATLPAMRINLAAPAVGNANKILKLMQNVVGFYGEWFTAFPWQQLNMTELENNFGGGQSFLSGIHINHNLLFVKPQNGIDLDAAELIAHEIGHQWWGNHVAPLGSADVALSESLAEFSAGLFVETQMQTRHLELIDNISYTFRVDAKQDVPIASSAVYNSASYVDIIYHKGAAVMHMLRRQLGDAAMAKGLHAFTAKFGRDFASVDDLRKTLEISSGQALGWFFTQWFKQKGLLRAEMAARLVAQDDGSWKVRVRIHQPDPKPRRFLLNATLYLASGEPVPLSVDVTPDAQGDAVVEWLAPSRPVRVRLDPDRLLLRQFATGTPGDVTMDGQTDGADFVDMALRMGHGLKVTFKGQSYFMPDLNFNELYDVTADLVIAEDDLDGLEAALGSTADAF